MPNDKLEKNFYRPREKLVKIGGEKLSSTELLAIILQTGYKNNGAMLLAQELLLKYNSISSFLEQSTEEMMTNKGIGIAKATKLKSIYYISLKVREEKALLKKKVLNKEDAFECFHQYASSDEENVYMICLNINHEILAVKHVFKGSLSSVMISPREIFRIALLENSKKIYLAHNHPSGDLTPSTSDIDATQNLIYLGDQMDVKIVDHIIMNENRYISFKDDFNICF